jgi:multidrug efflux pump
MVVHLVSPDERYDNLYLANYAHLRVKDELARIPGVGSAQIFGSGEYSMRIWLDPDRLASRQLTTTDVIRAIREQNVQVAAGVLGCAAGAGRHAISALGQRPRAADHRRRVRRRCRARNSGGADHARSRRRARSSSARICSALRSLLDNKPAVAIGIFQRPGTNALEASDQVHETMERLKQAFPEGVDYRIVYDPTVFVRNSIRAVVETLFEAILLVVLVVMVFLQTWRASIIPLVAVPVSLIGTFAVMLGLGFSLNTLSLFGLVLSIGIVVDDAIVVVENVERPYRAGALADRGDAARHGGSVWPDHRDRAGAVRGLRADGIRQRTVRAVLSPVRADDCHFDGHLGVQLR